MRKNIATKERLVEMYIGKQNGTWYTDYVGIPLDTPQNLIEKVAMEVAIKCYEKEEPAFIGLYNITEMSDEEGF